MLLIQYLDHFIPINDISLHDAIENADWIEDETWTDFIELCF